MSCNRAREIDVAGFLVERNAAKWDEFRDHYPQCGDCSQEVDRWRRLTSLLETENPRTESSGGENASAHLSEEGVLAFATAPSGMEPAQRQAARVHLDGCARCRSEVSALQGFDFARLAAPAPAPDASAPRAGGLRAWLASLAAVPVPIAAGALLLALAIPSYYLLRSAVPDGEGRVGPAPIAQIEVPEAPDRSAEAPLELAEEAPPAPPAETPGSELAESPPEEQLAEHTPEPVPPPLEPVEMEPELEAALQAEPLQLAALLPSERPLYAPELALSLGPASARVEGVVRGRRADALHIQVLAPEHVGLTLHESPTLYWYLSQDADLRVEVTLSDEISVKPVLDLTLEGPISAGLQAISLESHGVRLDPDINYRWFVSIVPDPSRPSDEQSSGGALRRSAPSPQLEAALADAGPATLAHLYARSGYWYDAFEQLSKWQSEAPGLEGLREHRAALLEQVALPEPAGFLREERR